MSRGQALPSAVFGNICKICTWREPNPAAPSVFLSLPSPRCPWEDRGGGHLSLQCTPDKGWTFLLMEEGGGFESWKGRRISLAWCVLLQKGGFSSKGKGNETEKCFLLSQRDGEPCVIVVSAGAARSASASSAAPRQRPEGAEGTGGLRDTGTSSSPPLRAGDSHSQRHGCQAVLGTGQVGALHTDPCGFLGRSHGGRGCLSSRCGLSWV